MLAAVWISWRVRSLRSGLCWIFLTDMNVRYLPSAIEIQPCRWLGLSRSCLRFFPISLCPRSDMIPHEIECIWQVLSALIESVSSFCSVAWFGYLSLKNKNYLTQIVKWSTKLTGELQLNQSLCTPGRPERTLLTLWLCELSFSCW